MSLGRPLAVVLSSASACIVFVSFTRSKHFKPHKLCKGGRKHTYNTRMQFICARTPTLWAHLHRPPYPVYAKGRFLQFCFNICVMPQPYVQVLPDSGKDSRQILTQLPVLFVASALGVR